MKYLKLFEDFNYDELVKEANMYKQIKDLPPDGNVDIDEQFEVLAWTIALDKADYSALNRVGYFDVKHISWSTIEKEHGRAQKRYGMRADVPDFLHNTEYSIKYSEKTCKFEDYFEIKPEYSGHKTGKQYGI
jgi:hypothetical protein